MTKFQPDTYVVKVYENGIILNAFHIHAINYKTAIENGNNTVKKVYRDYHNITTSINKVH